MKLKNLQKYYFYQFKIKKYLIIKFLFITSMQKYCLDVHDMNKLSHSI